MKRSLFSVIAIILSLLAGSCQQSGTNKWMPPKFVKEWEIKEIKPGLPHHIISMTANKNGVFMLVKAVERSRVSKKNLDEMTKEEKKYTVEWMVKVFGNVLSDAERFNKGGPYSGGSKEIMHYRVQHYDFNGTYLDQWPRDNALTMGEEIRNKVGLIKIIGTDREGSVDSSKELLFPLLVASDVEENIFLADYQGNKIVKFNSKGNVLNLWRISQDKDGWYRTLGSHKGLSMYKNRMILISEGYDNKAGTCPNISAYDLNGKLLREKIIKTPKVPAQAPITGKKLPFAKAEANVTDLAVDKEGNLYLFAADTKILKLDSQWNEIGYIETVLKEGFKRPKPVYDPDRKRTINYEDIILKETGVSFRDFSSDKLSLYNANKIHMSPNDELYVSIIGSKPFGVIDAMIYDKTGKMLGYWKNDKKSYADWFDKLSDLQKLETIDTGLEIAFQGKSIFIGRTLQEGTSGRKYHAVVQEFAR